MSGKIIFVKNEEIIKTIDDFGNRNDITVTIKNNGKVLYSIDVNAFLTSILTQKRVLSQLGQKIDIGFIQDSYEDIGGIRFSKISVDFQISRDGQTKSCQAPFCCPLDAETAESIIQKIRA